MILEFKTKRNTNGHRRYLAIDTGAECYARQTPRMIAEGVEITVTAMNELIEQCKRNEFTERDYIY